MQVSAFLFPLRESLQPATHHVGLSTKKCANPKPAVRPAVSGATVDRRVRAKPALRDPCLERQLCPKASRSAALL